MSTRGRTPILFVHHRSELGGAPASLSYLIAQLDKERFEPHVYCPPGPAADLFREIGAVVHTGPVAGFTHIWASVYHGRRWLLFGRELLRLPRHVIACRRLLRSRQWAVVHLNDSPLIPAAWLTSREQIPIVWHLRSALPNIGGEGRSALLRRIIGRLASVTVAINGNVGASFAIDSTIVSNAVDLDRFHPGDTCEARRSLGLPVDRQVVTFFGFIYASKGFREFIEAAAQVRDNGIDATFRIVGGAVRGESYFRRPVGWILQRLDLARNYEREARQLVRELRLEDVVDFVPFTRDTALLYRASDVVVAPSRGPELGRPVVEAAASGVAVVASGSTDGGGVILPDRTGLVVGFEVDDLSAGIMRLLTEPGLRARLGAAAREHAEATFSAADSAAKVVEIYERLAGRDGLVKVLYVHHRPQLGGAPSSLAELIRCLDERFEPYVYTPEGEASRLFEAAGARVVTGPASIFAHAWDNPYQGLRWLLVGRELWSLPRHVQHLGKLMRKERYAIVHLNDSPLLAAAWVAKRHGATVVWHLRSALANGGLDRRSRVIARLIDRWGDAAIAIDRDVADRFGIEIPVTIVHNSVRVPPAEIDATDAKERLALPADRVAIGFAGFVRRQKGWPELVDAAAILEERGAPAHFVVIGGGVRPPSFFRTPRGRILAALGLLFDEESAIKDYVRERRLEHRFSFLPFTTHTAEIYSALDIVTFPNQGVGLGRPVLEAAMHGKPVVASGSRDGAGLLLPEETGLLVEHPTPEALADALERLVGDRELRERLGAAAAAHARDRFDPQRNAERVEELYERLLGRD